MARYLNNADCMKARQIVSKKLTGDNRLRLELECESLVSAYARKEYQEVKEILYGIGMYLIALKDAGTLSESEDILLEEYYKYEVTESIREDDKYWKRNRAAQ